MSCSSFQGPMLGGSLCSRFFSVARRPVARASPVRSRGCACRERPEVACSAALLAGRLLLLPADGAGTRCEPDGGAMAPLPEDAAVRGGTMWLGVERGCNGIGATLAGIAGARRGDEVDMARC
jgi:hypothetical protein